MNTKFRALALATVASLGLVSWSVAAEPLSKEVKCPVSGQPAKADKFVEFADAKVYFCCPNCVKSFEENKAKYTTKANHQLVQTGQYEEVGCPITGGKLRDGTELDVAGVKLKFCCNNCKGKVEKAANDDDKMALVFKDLKKGYKKKN